MNSIKVRAEIHFEIEDGRLVRLPSSPQSPLGSFVAGEFACPVEAVDLLTRINQVGNDDLPAPIKTFLAAVETQVDRIIAEVGHVKIEGQAYAFTGDYNLAFSFPQAL